MSARKIEEVFGEPFIGGNRVSLLWKGSDSFRSIFDSIKKARSIICLEFYIFRNDETGLELARILRQKAAEGVKVYVLYDHFGSWRTPASFWKALEESGVHVKASRPFKWTSPFHYVHRDHRKLIIMDGIKAFTGGLNIANEYRGYRRIRRLRRKASWRDTGIFITGPAAASLFENFRKFWLIWKGEPIQFHPKHSFSESGIPVLPIFTNSARGRRRMRKLLYHGIDGAKKSIYLTTAYFTPSRRMLHVLSEAVARGVDVKLLLPGKTDVSAAWYAGRAFFSRLLRAGVGIYSYKGEILHAKTAVFDGVWSVVGSANLDFQSLRRNDEGNVGIFDEGFGGKMTEIFFEDLGNSDKIELAAWRNRSLSDKLREHFFALFRRRL